jgi:peptidoglycan-associated lipoprotein
MVEEVGPYNMYITESIRRWCSGPDPFFTFDSSKPVGDDQPTLKNLIWCMVSGPLQGKTVKLIGHADPRGTAGYNEQLGLHRAERVKKFLVTNGIDPARIETASVGSEEAGQAPKEWATDRRVEIQLVR